MNKQNNYNCTWDILKPCLIILGLIMIYSIVIHTFIKTKEGDPLIRMESKYFGNFLNGWTITHFIFFMYLGYYYPKCEKNVLILGIVWEFLEWSIGELFPILFPKLAFNIDPFWTSWYYGKIEDIIMNYIGFKMGQYLSPN